MSIARRPRRPPFRSFHLSPPHRSPAPSRSSGCRSRRLARLRAARCNRRWPPARCPACRSPSSPRSLVVYLKGFGVREIGKPGTVGAGHRVPARFLLEADLGHRRRRRRRRQHGYRLALEDRRSRSAARSAFSRLSDRRADGDRFFSHRSGLPGNAGNELEDLGFDRDRSVRSWRSCRSTAPARIIPTAISASPRAPSPSPKPRARRLNWPSGSTSRSA